MADDTKRRQEPGLSVDQRQGDVQADNQVDEIGDEAFGDDGVLFDELREVV